MRSCVLAFSSPQLIATACLFLAAKVEESPKQLKQVIFDVERVRHAKNIQVGGGMAEWVEMRLRESFPGTDKVITYIAIRGPQVDVLG